MCEADQRTRRATASEATRSRWPTAAETWFRAGGTSRSAPGSQAASGPIGLPGHPVRATYRYCLGTPAAGTWLRIGSKHHLITDATGIPLAVTLTGGNRNDVTQLIPLLAELRSAGALDFSRTAVDGSHFRALKGAPRRDEPLLTGAGRARRTSCSQRHTPASVHSARRPSTSCVVAAPARYVVDCSRGGTAVPERPPRRVRLPAARSPLRSHTHGEAGCRPGLQVQRPAAGRRADTRCVARSEQPGQFCINHMKSAVRLCVRTVRCSERPHRSATR